MKHLNKLIFPILGIVVLSSCSKSLSTDLKVITDEAIAVNLAKSILNRQQNSSGFLLYENPKNFVYKEKSIKSSSSKTDKGTTNYKSESKIEFHCDLKNFVIKIIENESQTIDDGKQESSMTTYHYYDKNQGIYYILYEENGLKTKEVLMPSSKPYLTQEQAITALTKIITDNSLYYTIRNEYALTNFEKTIKEDGEKHKEYISKGDEYFNYTLGSNDAKSLQLKETSKMKYSSEKQYDVLLTGYKFNTNNFIMRDDRLSYKNENGKIEAKSSDNKFYLNTSTNITKEFTYGNASIKIPDINNYRYI